MDRRRVALLLVVVGALCLPAPLYLGWAADATAPPAQTSQIYAAEQVDIGNIPDQKRFVAAHGAEVTFSSHQASERYSAGEYRSLNVTHAALKTAMREGSATVDDFGPGFGGFVAGVAVAAVGLVLLFLAAVVYLYERRTDSAGE